MSEDYQIIIQQVPDSDELFFEIPEDVLKRLGWGEGTDVEFSIVDGEGFMLKKATTDR